MLQLWEYLLIDRFGSKSSYEMHWKNFRVVKKVLENKLVGQKQHLRALLIDRTMLQHESLLERGSMCLTPTHCQIMLSLLKLSSSHYSEVSICAVCSNRAARVSPVLCSSHHQVMLCIAGAFSGPSEALHGA